MYRWFCNWEHTYLITADEFIKTLKLRGYDVTLTDIKEFWETNDKVDKNYLVNVDAELYRKFHQLK